VVNAAPRPIHPRGRSGTDCIGGWVGPKAGLEGCWKSRPNRDSIPSIFSPKFQFTNLCFSFRYPESYPRAEQTIKLAFRPASSHSIHLLDSSWNVMAHGNEREGKWRGNWRMEWVATNLHTTSEHCVLSIPLVRTPRPPVVDWTDAPTDLYRLVRFAERRNLVCALLRVCHHISTGLYQKIITTSWSEWT